MIVGIIVECIAGRPYTFEPLGMSSGASKCTTSDPIAFHSRCLVGRHARWNALEYWQHYRCSRTLGKDKTPCFLLLSFLDTTHPSPPTPLSERSHAHHTTPAVIPIVDNIGLGLGLLIWGLFNMITGWYERECMFVYCVVLALTSSEKTLPSSFVLLSHFLLLFFTLPLPLLIV